MNVTPPSHVQGIVDSSPLVHIVRYRIFNDGTGPSLCGRKPFPERWVAMDGGSRAKCPTCVDKWKAGR